MMWTADEIVALKDLWSRGLSGGQIATRVGKTRNAVIGKIYRLGLARNSAPTNPDGTKPPLVSHGACRRNKPKRAARPKTELPPSPVKAMTTLEGAGYGQCRWPMGPETAGGEMPMCGHETHTGSPYCPFHHAKAYVKPIKSKAKVKWANTWRAA